MGSIRSRSKHFDQVYEWIFWGVCKSTGFSGPCSKMEFSISWDIVLRCMGTPFLPPVPWTRLKKSKIFVNLRTRTIDGLVTYPEMSPKTLSIIAAGLLTWTILCCGRVLTKYPSKAREAGNSRYKTIFSLIGSTKKVDEAEKNSRNWMEWLWLGLSCSSDLYEFDSLKPPRFSKADNYKADGILKFAKQHNIAEEIGTYTRVVDWPKNLRCTEPRDLLLMHWAFGAALLTTNR